MDLLEELQQLYASLPASSAPAPAVKERQVEELFASNVERSLAVVRRLFDNERARITVIGREADSQHSYQDKFSAAEFVSSAALAATLHCLEQFGFGADRLDEMKRVILAQRASVSLHFDAVQVCTLVEKRKRIVVNPAAAFVVEHADGRGNTETVTRRTETTVEEHLWKLTSTFNFSFVIGAADKHPTLSRTGG